MSLTTSPPIDARAASIVVTNHAVIVLVSALVFLPCAIFAMSLAPLPAAAVILGCCGAMALIAGHTGDNGRLAEPIHVTRLLVAVALALLLLIIGGETHLFYATWDWRVRDAVLADLVRHGLATYRIGDADYLLRAPLGMYMAPALVGRTFGLFAAHLALLAQNATILGATFYLLATIGRGWGHLAIVVLFGGLSAFGALLIFGTTGRDNSHLLQFGLDSWHPYYQYSSSMVQLFWVPNHALPGWWLATLLLLQRRSSPDVATLGVSVAGLAFWSPLAVVPFVPWLLFSLASRWRHVLSSRRTWLGGLAALGFLPILAYMVLASSSIAHVSPTSRPEFFFWYELFVFFELPVLVFLVFVRHRIPEDARVPLALSALVLLALPFFSFGPNNDLVMRSSIAPLVIVAFVFGSVVIDLTRERRRAAVVGWVLVVAGTPSAIVEIGRALATPRYAISDCSLMQASHALGSDAVPSNYVAPIRDIPKWLMNAASFASAPTVKQACWPDKVAPRFFVKIFDTSTRP